MMSKSYCSKCGAPIEGDVGFCSHCGNRISENAMADTVQQVPKTVAKKAKRNPFAKFIFITIAAQILFLILSGMLNEYGGVMFLLAVVLSLVVLLFSILTIVKSSKYYGNGKAVGIVFTVLSSLLVVICAGAAISVAIDDSQDKGDNYIYEYLDLAATNSVRALKSSLKDPDSLKINRIYAKAYDTRIKVKFSDGTYYDGGDFKGYFEIFIDCTGANGFGGVTRSYYCFEWSQDMVCTDADDIDDMPVIADDVFVLDADYYNKLAKNMDIY